MASTSHVTSDLPPMPDLSHLTEEEKQIIQNVMLRQQQEEAKEHEIVRRKADEVKILEDTIRQRSEQQRKAGPGLDATCQLCLKTKFADGVGHVCAYCGVRCCARCGGKVTLRSNKVIWVCILCRKKQELLIKTGQWMTQPLLASTPEKENRGPPGRGMNSSRFPPPLQRTSSLQSQGRELPTPQLRRQYSQENRPPTSMIPTHHHMQRRASASEPEDYYPHHHYRDFGSEYGPPPPPAPSHPPSHYVSHQLTSHPIYSSTSTGIGPPPPQPPPADWTYEQPVRHLPKTSQSAMHSSSSQPHASGSSRLGVAASKGVGSSTGGQRSLSSSEEELRSTPDYTSGDELDPRHHHHLGQSTHLQQTSVYLHHHATVEPGGLSSLTKGAYDGAKTISGTSSVIGGTSLSQVSGSYHRYHHNTAPPERRRGYTDRRQKKTVRFDSDDFVGVEGSGVVGAEDEWFSWDQTSAERQGSQDSTTKDSGIDTCSNFTSSEDSNRELVHTKHPVSWRPNSDGTKLIGHMILKKDLRESTGSSAHILGLKVTGGMTMESGRLGAIVEKVKEGSIADVVGRVQPGDEVIEWNGRGLMDKTFDEVHEIIADSKLDPQVELVVSRPLGRRISNTPATAKSYLSIRKDYRRPSVTVTSPTSPDPPRNSRFGPVDQGKLQLKIWFDPVGHQLTVTVISACDLPSSRHGLPNPFAKLCLLPDRSEKWKRRSRTLQQTRDPIWNQTCVFAPIRLSEIRTRILQVTIWDCDRTGKCDYLGEASIELSTHPLDDETEWHFLTWDRKSSLFIDTETSIMPSSTEHLSPPSTTSRLSDSDTSEFDAERRLEIASISSSSSPPPDDLTGDRRTSRRDLSPLSRRVTDSESYSMTHTRAESLASSGRRSLSATTQPQFRSKSPPRRAYSPVRNEPSEFITSQHPQRVHRSATATPQGSPKKRQLPIVPPARERLSQEIDERARAIKARMRSSLSASSSYSSRGPSIENEGSVRSNRGLSPDREWADSDLESVTSAFSTQSENPNRLSSRTNLSLDLSHVRQSDSPTHETRRIINASNYIAPSQYRVHFRNNSLPEKHIIYSPTIAIDFESPRTYTTTSNNNVNANNTRAILSPESRRNLYQKSRFAHNFHKAEEYVKRTNVRRLSKDLTDTIDSIREIIKEVRNRLKHTHSEDSWVNIPYIRQPNQSSSENGKNETSSSCDVSSKKGRLSGFRQNAVVENEKVVQLGKSDRQMTGTCDSDTANANKLKNDSLLSLKKEVSSDRQLLLFQSNTTDQLDVESESSLSSEHINLRVKGLEIKRKAKTNKKAEKSEHLPKCSNFKSKRSKDNTTSQNIKGSISCTSKMNTATGNKSLWSEDILSGRAGHGPMNKNKSAKTDGSLHASKPLVESKSSPKKSSNSSSSNPSAFDNVEVELVEVTRGGNCSPDRDNCSEYALRHPKRNLGTRSLSSETAPEEKADGSLSDTAVNLTPGSLERPRGHRVGGGPQRLMAQNMSGLGKKSSSTSQLSATGRKRRLGFGRSKAGIGIHRSEEVLPDDLRLAVSQMGSSISSEDMSASQDTSDSSWMPRLAGSAGEGGHITDFIEGLGPGQLVGRQVLASPSLGDIQLSLCDRKGNLEVEVIRARSLQAKTGSKVTPTPYVKVYLVKGKKCVAKAKTGITRRTLDPLYQQQLVFREKYQGCILQVTVWGDYGRIEGRKIFMGVAQIMLDDLDLTNIVIDLRSDAIVYQLNNHRLLQKFVMIRKRSVDGPWNNPESDKTLWIDGPFCI